MTKWELFFFSISVMFCSFGYGGDDSLGEILEASTWCFCICSSSRSLQCTVHVGSLYYCHSKRFLKIFDGFASRFHLSLSVSYIISLTCILLQPSPRYWMLFLMLSVLCYCMVFIGRLHPCVSLLLVFLDHNCYFKKFFDPFCSSPANFIENISFYAHGLPNFSFCPILLGY